MLVDVGGGGWRWLEMVGRDNNNEMIHIQWLQNIILNSLSLSK